MTVTFGFYNSLSGDRPYDSLQMSRIFDGLINDGVYETLGDRLMVSEADTPGMVVVVGTGRAWFDHTWTHSDAPLYLPLEPAHALLSRIDVVYLEVNSELGIRANKIDVVSGEFSLTPVAPELTNTETIHQYPLGLVTVNAAVTSILTANIENKVGTVDCPFVICPVTHITTSALLVQWEAQWEAWFNAIKGQLSEDPATNLYNMILALEDFFKHDATYNRKLYIPAQDFKPLDSNVSLIYSAPEGYALYYLADAVGEAACAFGLPPDLDPTSQIQMTVLYAMNDGTAGAWTLNMHFAILYPGKVRFSDPSLTIITSLTGTTNTFSSSRLYQGFLIEDSSPSEVVPGDFVEGTFAHVKLTRNGTGTYDVNTGTVLVYGLVVEYVSKPQVLN